MQELIREAKSRIGVFPKQRRKPYGAHVTCPVTAIQNRYSMMARYHESLLPVLEELGIGFSQRSPPGQRPALQPLQPKFHV